MLIILIVFENRVAAGNSDVEKVMKMPAAALPEANAESPWAHSAFSANPAYLILLLNKFLISTNLRYHRNFSKS